MIGIGSWKFSVDTLFYRGDAVLTLRDNNGAYDAEIVLEGMEAPQISFSEVKEEGSTVSGTAHTDMLKGKHIPFSVTFEGDTASGSFKVPCIGKIQMKNGKRVA